MLSQVNTDRAWVSGQILLIALVVVAAMLGPHWPAALVLAIAGVTVTVAGGLAMLWGGRTLGRSLTPYPSPRGAHLERGPYRFVRQPMYGGGIVLATGIALASSPLALAPALALIPFFLVKARYEERLLAQADPGYGEYLGQVRRRFFPGLL
jgi:protein-S-isoprenylcysteine O-methyltransferase Ste14